jgi:hypothetical protein
VSGFGRARLTTSRPQHNQSGGKRWAAPKTVTLDDDVYDGMQQEADADGKTVDQLTSEVVQCHSARRWLERTGGEASSGAGT